MGSGTSIACDISLNTALTPEQRSLYQDTAVIREILRHRGTVAVVGLSADPQKASYFVASYLQKRGWRVIPVSPKPGLILGEPTVPRVDAIQGPVDVVNILRPPAEIPDIVDQAIAVRAGAVWMQLKLIHLGAAAKARAAGLRVVVDRCIKMEHGRHFGGLHSAGMNTEIISARRALP